MDIILMKAFEAAASTTTEEQQAAATAQGGMLIFWCVVMVLMFYFVLYRPQKKKEKEQKALRESLKIGDEVTTIGGIVGFILSIKDDTVLIETGGDRNKIRVKTWAISTNDTKHDADGEEAAKEEIGKRKKTIE